MLLSLWKTPKGKDVFVCFLQELSSFKFVIFCSGLMVFRLHELVDVADSLEILVKLVTHLDETLLVFEKHQQGEFSKHDVLHF